MIFLLRYNRKAGQIVSRQRFEDHERSTAHRARLELEIDLNEKGIEDEVVLLEAANENILRRTHRRYFENLRELTSAPAH